MTKIKAFFWKRQKSPAQAALEFALALPVLLLVLYGLLETGRLLFIYASTVTAARQAVRYGSATGLNASSIPYYQDCDGIRNAVHRVGFINRFEDSDIAIAYDRGLEYVDPPGTWEVNQITNPDPDCDGGFSGFDIRKGDRIRVEVSEQWVPIVPLVPFEPFTITSESSRTILSGVSIYVTAPASFFSGSGGGELTLAVSASPETYDTLGQIITYTYTITNVGTDVLSGTFDLQDVPVATNDCDVQAPGVLAVGASFTCTGTYAITQDDLDDGTLTDVAQASANTGTIFSNLDGTTVTAIQLPALYLAKTGSPEVSSVAGTVVTYTYTLTNSGNVRLRAPYAVADDHTNDETCPATPSPLDPGSYITCTATYTIKQSDLNAGTVINHATATALWGFDTVTSNEATFTVFTPPIFLTIEATPMTVSSVGQIISYKYWISNETDRNITQPYSVTDSLVSPISCAVAVAADPLVPNEQTYCTGQHTVTQANLDSGLPITNTATATGRQGGQTRASQLASASVAVMHTASLSLQMSANPTTATSLGTVVTYTYVLTNAGNVTLSPPFTVTDNMATGITCASPTSTLAPNGGTKTCTGSRTISQTDLDNGSVINTATASAKFGLQTVTSSQQTATVITFEGARLGLKKTGSPPFTPIAGQLITYTYRLRNTGNVALTSPYAVSDDVLAADGSSVDCSSAVSPLAIGASTTCTGFHTTTSSPDLAAGYVTNYATATAQNGASVITSNEAHATIIVSAAGCNTKHSALKTTPFGMTIFNNNPFDLSLSSVTINFNDSPSTRTIVSILLGASSIWTNSIDFPTPITATPLSGDVTVAANSSKILQINLNGTYTANNLEWITVAFAEGCQVLDSRDASQLQ